MSSKEFLLLVLAGCALVRPVAGRLKKSHCSSKAMPDARHSTAARSSRGGGRKQPAEKLPVDYSGFDQHGARQRKESVCEIENQPTGRRFGRVSPVSAAIDDHASTCRSCLYILTGSTAGLCLLWLRLADPLADSMFLIQTAAGLQLSSCMVPCSTVSSIFIAATAKAHSGKPGTILRCGAACLGTLWYLEVTRCIAHTRTECKMYFCATRLSPLRSPKRWDQAIPMQGGQGFRCSRHSDGALFAVSYIVHFCKSIFDDGTHQGG